MKKQNGITLIALIITIIVMLILVGVTVTVALNGGLFSTAKKATRDTQTELDKEQTLASGIVEINGVWYDSMEDYVNNKPGLDLPEGWSKTAKPAEWDNDKIAAITDGTNTLPLPEGYKVSDVEGENTIEKGVVIKDSKGNEFVWIPVSQDFVNPYNLGSNNSEPKELSSKYSPINAAYDSQPTLNYLYGTKEDGSTPFYNYETDFAYSIHYEEMVASVNKYDGFYIGRYETTIDENNEIGTKANKTVLTADKTISQTNNKETRWYGLYNTQRNSNVIGNKDYIQTNMIWGQQWDKMIEYFNTKKIDYSAWGKSTQGKVVKSAESTNASGKKDEIYNIYDLRTNGVDWTAEASFTGYRTIRGGDYYGRFSASYRGINYPTYAGSDCCSRFTLYIK